MSNSFQAKASLAVVALFYGVDIWNAFFNAILYLNDASKWPIQLVLRQYVLQGSALASAVNLDPNQAPPPGQSIQMAVVVLATVPILLVYPFLQKYFSKGVLTGAIKDIADVDGRRAAHPRFQAENFAHNRELVAKIEAIALEKSCTPAQVTLAWLLAQGDDVVAIPGTRYENRLDENLGGLRVSLSTDEVARISAAVPAGAASGERYPAAGMKAVYM